MRRKLLAIKVGEKFGRWTIKEPPYRSPKRSLVFAVCECECGTVKTMPLTNMLRGGSLSCGCLVKDNNISRTVHGHSRRGKRERLYTTWHSMLDRCTNPNQVGYKHYGGRGIHVCKEWTQYIPFMEWATASGYRDDLTIERIDCNGNYCPSNCTWIPRTRQNRNRRDTRMLTAFGETKGIADWADDARCMVKVMNIFKRLDLGWNVEDAISCPKQHRWSRRGANVRPVTST